MKAIRERLITLSPTMLLIVVCLAVFSARGAEGKVYRDRVNPHWYGNNSKFWYENDLAGGVKEFVVVDAERGVREKVEKPPADEAASEARDSADDPAEGRRRRRENAAYDKSPDEKWVVIKRDHNLFIKSAVDEKEIQLTRDGKEGLSYEQWSWSPNSKTLAAFRIEPGDKKEVHLIQSSPPGGGRAKLQSRPYALPGDKFAHYELNIFDIATQKRIKPEGDQFEHEWERRRA